MCNDISVLIADDDPDVLSATARMVRSEGYAVDEAETGAGCLEMAKKNKPDLILLDVILPDIMGTEICRRIKADPFFEGTLVILMSGMKTASTDQAGGLEAGADGYIARPLSNAEFKARVHAMVRILIAERQKFFNALKKTNDELVLRNQIFNHFLVYPDFHALEPIFHLLQDTFQSRSGYFGYINQKGVLVVPSGAGNIRKKSRDEEDPDTVLVVHLVAGQTLVGQVFLAGRTGGFTPEDRAALESIAAFMAPVLSIYSEKEFARKSLEMSIEELKHKNIALNVLLEKLQENKRKLVDSLLDDFSSLVFPYIEQLRKCRTIDDVLTISDIIEIHLQECLYPFEKSFSSVYRKLTPMEIQVADFIKAGKTSKEICAILNISLSAVHFHRNNIRKKLNISNKKANLRTLLLSLS
jgi:DNA-binding NarL/FixJ family response regulator